MARCLKIQLKIAKKTLSEQGILLNIKHLSLYSLILMCSACTSGQLYYVDTDGSEKLGCEYEFVGTPSVDKYAVEYALSLCAKSIVKKGGVIQEKYLLKIDTSIPLAPCGKAWTHELAKKKFNSEEISKKEYGYIVANIDMGFSAINKCSHNKKINKNT